MGLRPCWRLPAQKVPTVLRPSMSEPQSKKRGLPPSPGAGEKAAERIGVGMVGGSRPLRMGVREAPVSRPLAAAPLQLGS